MFTNLNSYSNVENYTKISLLGVEYYNNYIVQGIILIYFNGVMLQVDTIYHVNFRDHLR